MSKKNSELKMHFLENWGWVLAVAIFAAILINPLAAASVVLSPLRALLYGVQNPLSVLTVILLIAGGVVVYFLIKVFVFNPVQIIAKPNGEKKAKPVQKTETRKPEKTAKAQSSKTPPPPPQKNHNEPSKGYHW